MDILCATFGLKLFFSAPSPPTAAISLLMFRNSSSNSSSQRKDHISNFGIIAYNIYRTEREKGHQLFHLPMKRTTSIKIIVRNTLFQNNATLLQTFMRKILCHLQKHTDMKIILRQAMYQNDSQCNPVFCKIHQKSHFWPFISCASCF